MRSTAWAGMPPSRPLKITVRGWTVWTSGWSARKVRSPTSTSPGSAACCRRAATLTASPVTRKSRPMSEPVATTPVLTPTRRIRSWPWRRAMPVSRDRMPSAARTARSGSSSCAVGTPNTAMIASPMNFSTVPPNDATTWDSWS